MADQHRPDPEFDATTSRLLRREALRRAAKELNTTSGPGLEGVLERISAEVTADAAANRRLPTATLPRRRQIRRHGHLVRPDLEADETVGPERVADRHVDCVAATRSPH